MGLLILGLIVSMVYGEASGSAALRVVKSSAFLVFGIVFAGMGGLVSPWFLIFVAAVFQGNSGDLASDPARIPAQTPLPMAIGFWGTLAFYVVGILYAIIFRAARTTGATDGTSDNR